jgi:hypothetical protein
MTRLVAQIQSGHRQRQQMMLNFKREHGNLRRTVKRIRKATRDAHKDMSARQRQALEQFISGLEKQVSGLRKKCADDLLGARNAWLGKTSVSPVKQRAGKSA